MIKLKLLVCIYFQFVIPAWLANGQDYYYRSVVDIQSPIVIHDTGTGSGENSQYSGERNYGSMSSMDNESYFGYSLAFMKHEAQGGHSAGTLFIGAPNEKTTPLNSGVVWQCQLNSQSASTCSILSSISSQNSPASSTCTQLFKNTHFPEPETDQWIGASLAVSSNKNLFACAPRWKKNGFRSKYTKCVDETAMVGACYVTSPSNPHQVQVLAPLDQPDEYYYESQSFHDRINEYLFLYAELGFSSHVMSPETILFGAPNVRKWKGAVVEYPISPTTKFRRSQQIVHSYGEGHSIEPHSLLGYAVTSGRTFNQGYFIASGAPRAGGLFGRVTISKPNGNYEPLAVFSGDGDQYGSYFGYCLAALDTNGDGNDELLVGAPLHTPDFRTNSRYNTGCVLVFDVVRKVKVLTICPPADHVYPGARFGSGITNLGDINFDQNQDFAVSAPYAENDIGKIFIYYGGYPLSDKPAQIISGKNLGVGGLHGLGTYLLGGPDVDVDGNGTPDLVAGAWESRHVVIFRTRPIARLTFPRITFHSGDSRGPEGEIFKLLPNEQKFRARICVNFAFSVKLPQEILLDMWAKFDVDPVEKRVDFENSRDSQENKWSLSSQGGCTDKLVQVVKTNVELKGVISFESRLWYNQTRQEDNLVTRDYASILVTPKNPTGSGNSGDREYQQAFRKFDPFLPAPIPQFNFRKDLVIGNHCESDGKPGCDPDLKLKVETAFQDISSGSEKRGKNFVVGKLGAILVSILMSNHKETADVPSVRVKVNLTENVEMNAGQVSWSLVKVFGKPGTCKEDTVEEYTASTVSQDLKAVRKLRCPQPLHQGEQLGFEFKVERLAEQMKMNGKGNNAEMTITVEVFPEGFQRQEGKTEVIKIGLEGDVQIRVDAESEKQGEVDPEQTTLIDLVQIFTIKNAGYSETTRSSVVADIFVPTRLVHSQFQNLTQVIEIADPSTPSVRCSPVDFSFFDPSSQNVVVRGDTRSSNPGHGRTTRSAPSKSGGLSLKVQGDTKVPEPEKLAKATGNYISLSGCNPNRKETMPNCQQIRCHTELGAKASREIRLQFYSIVKKLKIEEGETKGILMESQISVLYGDRVIATAKGKSQRNFVLVKGVPAWIYLAAGAGGTVLFLLVTFALFKCGFFRRKTKDKLKQLKRQTMQNIDANALALLNASIAEEEEDREEVRG